MGTPRQAALIVALSLKLGKITTSQAADVEQQALDATPQKTREIIDSLNDQLGFDRRRSPATISQRRMLLDLETEISGKWETTHDVALTYAEADARIQYFLALRKARKPAAVTDMFTRKAVGL